MNYTRSHLGGGYYLYIDRDNLNQYAIFRRTAPGFMQQITRWYYYEQCARNAYYKLVARNNMVSITAYNDLITK